MREGNVIFSQFKNLINISQENIFVLQVRLFAGITKRVVFLVSLTDFIYDPLKDSVSLFRLK